MDDWGKEQGCRQLGCQRGCEVRLVKQSTFFEAIQTVLSGSLDVLFTAAQLLDTGHRHCSQGLTSGPACAASRNALWSLSLQHHYSSFK